MLRRAPTIAGLVAVFFLASCRPKDATPEGATLVDWREPSLPAIPNHALRTADEVIEWTPAESHGTFVLSLHTASDTVSFPQEGGLSKSYESPVVIKLLLVKASRGRKLRASCEVPREHHFLGSHSFGTITECSVSIADARVAALQIGIQATGVSFVNAGLGNATHRPLVH